MTLRPEPYLRFWNEATFLRVERLSRQASDLGVSTAGLALAWLRHHPDISASIVGPRRLEHFVPIEEAMRLELRPSEWEAVGQPFSRQEDT
jgi:aryl-alcohol dehydrogenase-like predicted oxidoreductase